MSSDEPVALSALGRQVDDIIEAGTEWPELARQLDVDRYERSDKHYENPRAKPFRPMFLTALYAAVEDKPLSAMHNHLESNPDLASAFGFDPDDLPSKSTFLPIRVNARFADLERDINTTADDIRQVALSAGSPIGNPVTDMKMEADEGDLSKRTVNRLLRSKSNEILDELQDSGFFSFELPRPENPIYDQADLLTLSTLAALDGQAANGAGDALGDRMNPDPDPFDDPFYLDGPSGETLLESIKELSVDEIADLINESLEKTYTRAKPKLEKLDKSANVQLAIDVTYVAYYGDEDYEWVVGAPSSKDYQWCHKFATAVIVGENTHYVVGVEPLGSSEYTDNAAYPNAEKNYRVGAITRRLLNRADEFVDIRVVYADREFYATDVFTAMENRDLFYVIPAPARKRLKRKVGNFDALKEGFEDDERDIQLHVEKDYPVRGSVKGETTMTNAYTNLVILPPDDESDFDGPQPFATNLAVNDEIRLDRVQTVEKIQRYDYRGGIETSYRSIKECAAWTTSHSFEVRWFHFAFGCVLYNMWLLVDLLTQARIGQIETRTEPRITLQRFLKALDRELSKRIEIE